MREFAERGKDDTRSVIVILYRFEMRVIVCVDLFDVDLTDVGIINDVGKTVFSDDRFLVDPPIGSGIFDPGGL
ncbi:MAG: hypothetical protein MJ082_04130 [Clostridia bacterium]|nr:hypothetical protein [Clostridia bacterium]